MTKAPPLARPAATTLGGRKPSQQRNQRLLGLIAVATVALPSLTVFLVQRRGRVVLPPRPPALDFADGDSSGASQLRRSAATDGALAYGASTLDRIGRLWSLRLVGDPAERGRAAATLVAPLFDAVAGGWHARVADLAELRPGFGWWGRWRQGLRRDWYLHDLVRAVPEELRVELEPFAHEGRPRGASAVAAYTAAVVASSVDHAVATLRHRPALGGFTLGAAPLATADHHLLVARAAELTLPGDGAHPPSRWPTATASGERGHARLGELDAAGASSPLTAQRLVVTVVPREGIGYVTVGWPGSVGVVTGLNARRVFVSVQGAATDDSDQEHEAPGQSALWLARAILERCSTLREAIALAVATPLAGAHSITLADGTSSELAVVEKSPTTTAVRRSSELLFSTGHLEHERFRGDATNNAAGKGGAQGLRAQRLTELLEINVRASRRVPVTVERMVEVLRDRAAVGGKTLPLGEPAALESLRSVHAVIADVTEGILWVAEPPYALGAFHPFDVTALTGAQRPTLDSPAPAPGTAAGAMVAQRSKTASGTHPGAIAPAAAPPSVGLRLRILPADPLSGSAALTELEAARAALARAFAWVHSGEDGNEPIDHALVEAHRAALLAPDLAAAHYLLGLLFEYGGDAQAARRAYGRYLALSPASDDPVERERLRGLVSAAMR